MAQQNHTQNPSNSLDHEDILEEISLAFHALKTYSEAISCLMHFDADQETIRDLINQLLKTSKQGQKLSKTGLEKHYLDIKNKLEEVA